MIGVRRSLAVISPALWASCIDVSKTLPHLVRTFAGAGGPKSPDQVASGKKRANIEDIQEDSSTRLMRHLIVEKPNPIRPIDASSPSAPSPGKSTGGKKAPEENIIADASSAIAQSPQESLSAVSDEARRFREFASTAAPFLGCSTSDLHLSHEHTYQPIEKEWDLYPESVWGKDTMEVQLVDMYRRHNITMPCQPNQRVFGTVVALAGLRVTVDAGYGELSIFFKKVCFPFNTSRGRVFCMVIFQAIHKEWSTRRNPPNDMSACPTHSEDSACMLLVRYVMLPRARTRSMVSVLCEAL